MVEKFALVTNVSGRSTPNTAIIATQVSTRPERSSAGASARAARARRVGAASGAVSVPSSRSGAHPESPQS